MIALLDPLLFVRSVDSTNEPLPAEIDECLATEIKGLLEALRTSRAELAVIDDYWEHLWREIIGPLEKRVRNRGTKQALHELRKAGRNFTGLAAAPDEIREWGFHTMFGVQTGLSEVWERRMKDAVSRVLLCGHRVLLLTRLIEGRNLHVHTGRRDVVIHEITRWRLSMRIPGEPHISRIPCIRSKEQIDRGWTIRLDERLPTNRDDVPYPYCIPERWFRRDTQVVTTMNGGPVWRDAARRGWTWPNIPGGRGYHWDVNLKGPMTIEQYHVEHLNITQWGGVPDQEERAPGTIHHIKGDKGKTPKGPGWACP